MAVGRTARRSDQDGVSADGRPAGAEAVAWVRVRCVPWLGFENLQVPRYRTYTYSRLGSLYMGVGPIGCVEVLAKNKREFNQNGGMIDNFLHL